MELAVWHLLLKKKKCKPKGLNIYSKKIPLDRNHCFQKMWVLLASISNCILETEILIDWNYPVKLRMEIGSSTYAAPLFWAMKLEGQQGRQTGYWLYPVLFICVPKRGRKSETILNPRWLPKRQEHCWGGSWPRDLWHKWIFYTFCSEIKIFCGLSSWEVCHSWEFH